MRPSQIPPLDPFRVISTRLHTPQSLSWSCDGELAVAADDSLHIYLPHFRNEPQLGEEDSASSVDGDDGDDEGENGVGDSDGNIVAGAEGNGGEAEDRPAPSAGEKPWFLKKNIAGRRQYSAAPLRILIPHMTDPRANRDLLARTGATVNFDEEEDDFMGVGVGVVTGFGSGLNQVVGVHWSPSGLGPNLRPIVTALLTKGMILAYGEVLGKVAEGGTSRDFRFWKLLWGIGGSMPLPDRGGFSVKGDRIKAFSWAGEVGSGRGLLGYHTDADELVVMAVQYVEAVEEPGMNSQGPAWRIDEVSRVKIKGPHVVMEVHDPDYVPSGSAFSIKWSPWVLKDGERTAVVAYVAPNYVGFRSVTVVGGWQRGKRPEVRVSGEDILGICCHLSSDAFVVWEEAVWDVKGTKVSRGLIATPFTVEVFQVDMFGQTPSKPRHSVRDCNTLYPQGPDLDHRNPITGLTIQPPPPNSTTATHPVPIYTLTRLTATSTTKNWFQHNNPDPLPLTPAWAIAIDKLITSTVPESQSYYPIDSASDASSAPSDDEAEINDARNGDEARVAPRRVRIWAMAQSAGGGTSAVLFSKHSTLMPDRVCKSRVAFAPVKGGTGASAREGLTAEGRAWEWMYGGRGEVPGFSGDVEPALGAVFAGVVGKMGCVLCKGELEAEGGEYVCTAGHYFARCATSSLPILAPSTSRLCSLCGKQNLLVEELLRLADKHGISEVDKERVRHLAEDVCSACGGKFIV
ncbi:uncharacterized protein DNG_01459 [Cephalotrichum gorgonifer]|uniref:Transcription factor IIIC subunit delta N-term-domain-containing protein n=1 Tax=Cephalotrichum gorgonifer TaxID=2041049 RepID=A0AAE8MR02_9PEZI|nr:uncharacterized protein DNG_01459 [Cephalotrichum gorgonifer]